MVYFFEYYWIPFFKFEFSFLFFIIKQFAKCFGSYCISFLLTISFIQIGAKGEVQPFETG
jgi:hypothetical protein